MADQLKAVDGGKADNPPAPEHNSKERGKIIAECAVEMRSIIKVRKQCNDDAGDIRERLRDNGINVPSFQAALRLAEMEDGAARDTYIDGLKEAFTALGIGQQSEMFAGPAAA